MLEIQPAQLPFLARSLPSGTLIFCHEPLTINPHTWGAGFMRWVLRSRYHHGAVLWKAGGRIFVCEATFFDYFRPKDLEKWCNHRKAEKIRFVVQEIPDDKICAEFDKKYDKAAALSLVNLRITGRWNGRTNEKSAEKDFCFEALCRMLGIDKAYMAGIKHFDKLLNGNPG